MPITLQSLDVVVAGRFNPHIITPDWLKNVGICQTAAEVEMGVEILPGGPSFHFEVDSYKWQVTDSRLRISTTSLQRNPARRAADVLEVLPHTPIAALGHNCVYRCDIGDWQGDCPTLGGTLWRDLESHGTPQQVTWSCALELSGKVFNLKLEQTSLSVQINTNMHRNVSEVGQVVEAASGFESDVALSSMLVSNIAGDEVVNDD